MRVICIGARPPVDNAKLVREQFKLAHRYRNTLIEIEAGRRRAIGEMDRDFGDTRALEANVKEANAEVERILAEIARERANVFRETGKKSRATPPHLAETLKTAKEALAERRKNLSDERNRLRNDDQRTVCEDEIAKRANALVCSARHYCGLAFGTYLRVEAAHQSSCRDTPLYTNEEVCVPRFVRAGHRLKIRDGQEHDTSEWTDEGEVAVHMQPPVSAQTLFDGTHGHARIERIPYQGDRVSKRAQRCEYAVLHLRVNAARGAAEWARFPIKLDQEIPKNAIVKWVVVQMRRIGWREEWRVIITVDTDYVCTARSEEERQRTVAVNVGWREQEDTIRAAHWRDTDGNRGDCTLDSTMISALRHYQGVRSRRDKEFNEARGALVDNLADLQVPEWFAARTKALPLWRSQGRLTALVETWEKRRFDGDAAAFEALERWRYHDRHLLEWEAEQRTKALRCRRDFFRCFAKDLALRYGKIVIGKFSLAALAKKPSPEEAPNNDQANSNRHMNAPSELITCIQQAAQRYGAEFVNPSAVDATRTCEVCGLVEAFDAKVDVMRTPVCSGCGETWDQDDNHCATLLARERLRVASAAETAREEKKTSDTEEVGETKWARARRKREEKKVRVEAARERLAKIKKS